MFYSSLHRIGRSAPGRGAFSLAELVISMGILVLMLSLAGQVFTLTIQSTGQATALTESMQALRVFEQTLREDLRHVHPGRSLMVIQGNPVNAYWTTEGKATDPDGNPAQGDPYPHPIDPERDDPNGRLVPPRADVLMFFTERRATSFSASTVGSSPVTSNLQQVVYGHAELGDFVADPTDPSAVNGFVFQEQFPAATAGLTPQAFPTEGSGGAAYPSTERASVDPAENWHLARRSVLLLPTNSPACLPVAPYPAPITRLDDAPHGRLLNAESDLVCFDGKAVAGFPPFTIENHLLLPQWDPTSGAPLGAPWFPPAIFGSVGQPYADWFNPLKRSRLDPTPPPTLASRLAHYMLPRCASFKVEWSLNPRSEFVDGRLGSVGEMFWFDPGDNGDPADTVPSPDPLRALQDRVDGLRQTNRCRPTEPQEDALCLQLENLLNTRTTHSDGGFYSLSDRFRTNGFPGADADAWDPIGPAGRSNPGNLVLFAASRPLQPQLPNERIVVPDDVFPSALRITVDLFDKDRRLDKPIRHVMVIPVGE